MVFIFNFIKSLIILNFSFLFLTFKAFIVKKANTNYPILKLIFNISQFLQKKRIGTLLHYNGVDSTKDKIMKVAINDFSHQIEFLTSKVYLFILIV